MCSGWAGCYTIAADAERERVTARIRSVFERELKELQDDVLLMGSMVDKQIARAVESLKRRDFAAAHARDGEEPAGLAARLPDGSAPLAPRPSPCAQTPVTKQIPGHTPPG